MRCPSCRHENPGRARFCLECGAGLGVRCARCNAELPGGAKFCLECGAAVAGSPPAPAPEAYTPRHLAEKILSSRSSLEGERKQVTVLFADLKGSMNLSETIDPEEWHGIMDRFFQILNDGVHRFEGTVNQYAGDGIMALFGAPIAHEDHAQRACYAALSLQKSLGDYADELRVKKGINFSVRMGLNSGEVVVGRIGDDLRMDYTALGHTASLAARMEQIAEPGRIYVAEATTHLVDGFFRLRDLGRHEVKGVSRPVGVFELEEAGGILTRLQAAERRGFSRFIGRDAEMHTLDSTLAAAIEGQGRIVGVVGEPGVGKSRLCLEFVTRARARGISVYEGHCPAHGKTIPYIPVLELFRAYFAISERDSAVDMRRKIAGGLLLLDEAFREVLPLVFEFLAVPDPKNPAPQMDPQAKQRQIYAFLRSLVRARSEAEPAVILVDDLHWVDGASDAFFAELAEALEGTRTLFLANFRPEYSAGWMRKSTYHQIALKPLGPGEIELLVSELVGSDPSVSRLPERIRQRTQGNPFFIEETIQDLVEMRKLEGRRGAFKLVSPGSELDLPPTVQVVLAARIDRLPEREKGLLQSAAVIGKNFPGRVLREVAGAMNEDLASSLSALREKELIYETELFPEAEYAFKHPLTHEVAYHSQLASRRRAVHASVARAIEGLYPDKLDERAALLAHHWEAAGDALPAARWNRRAAEWAGANAPAEALRHWRKVRELLKGVPENRETLALGIAACAQILSFGWRIGLSEEEAEKFFDEGRALATRAGDNRSLAVLLWAMGGVVGLAGNPGRGIELETEAVRIADATADLGLRLTARFGLAYFYYTAGLLDEAIALTGAISSKPPDDVRVGADIAGFAPYIQMRMWRGACKAYVSDLGEAEEALKDAVEVARRHRGDVDVLCMGLSSLSDVAELRGDREAALRHAREAVEIGERTGAPFSRVFARIGLARAQVLVGTWKDASVTAREALTLARESRTGLDWDARIFAALADAELGAGELERARNAAMEAVQTAERRATRIWEIFARLTLARVLVAADAISAAEAAGSHLAEALVLIEQTGAKTLEPFVCVERANLARLCGDERAHERELRQAQQLFLEIGAPLRAAEAGKQLGA